MSQLDDVLNVIGDIAHESYLGCESMDGGDYWYGYKNEVINLLADERVKPLIKNLMLELHTVNYNEFEKRLNEL